MSTRTIPLIAQGILTLLIFEQSGAKTETPQLEDRPIRFTAPNRQTKEINRVDTKDLVHNLVFEYHSIVAANPNWTKSLWGFLTGRDIEPDDIWSYAPEAGRQSDKPEPDWM
jgi:hypothetical protein